MYEYQTFDTILERLRSNNLLQGLDTREGSVIYNALAPAAAELAKLYVSLEIFFQETFADTASMYSLMRRAAERGIARRMATAAIVQGEFSPAGTEVLHKRLACGELIFFVTEKTDLGTYKLECETKGEAGNLSAGQLIPVDYIPGLETARITALLTPGENDEDTESLRKRFMESLNPMAYGGNIADYKTKVRELPGVGGVKVYPVWNGGGTVKLVIINSAYGVPSQEQINEIQAAMDPVQNSGEGMGIAPVGHAVTVKAVGADKIDIRTVIDYSDTWTWEDIKAGVYQVVDEYYLELAREWEQAASTVVRISQLESRLLKLEGVRDIGNTEINGLAENYALPPDMVPVRGSVNG